MFLFNKIEYCLCDDFFDDFDKEEDFDKEDDFDKEVTGCGV